MAKLEAFEVVTEKGIRLMFRSLIPADAEAFLVYRKQIPLDSTHTMQYQGMKFPSIDEAAERLRTQLEDRVQLSIGIFESHRVVGSLNFRMHNPEHPWIQHVGEFGMTVLKEYWGQGLGKRLLLYLDQHARSIGVTRIEANVRTANERGVRLYQGSGFQIEGTRRQAAKINGEYQDEYYIAKLLK